MGVNSDILNSGTQMLIYDSEMNFCWAKTIKLIRTNVCEINKVENRWKIDLLIDRNSISKNIYEQKSQIFTCIKVRY